MNRNRLRKDQHELVFKMFEQGLSKRRIADSLHVPVGAVSKVIFAKYGEFDGRILLPVKDIVKRYNSGETMQSLSIDYDVTIKTIRSRLESAGVEILSTGEQQRVHFFNENYFEIIDTEEKAYWLGFIFADGCVHGTRADISIALNQKDEPHLKKFSEALEYNGPGLVKNYVSTGYGINVDVSKISLRSEKMWNDLILHGCLPNKSIDCGPPEGVPQEYECSFIRGIVDGDGYISGQGVNSIEIVGAYPLLEWVASRLDLSQPRPHKNIWRIRASGNKAYIVAKELYSNATVFLDRKKDRADKMVSKI